MAPGMNHCEGGKINPPGPSIARIERGAPMKLRNPKFLTVSALCGSLGVLSGYAIYLTYEQVHNTGDNYAQVRFWFTLLITAVISYSIEWIREVIREGRIEHATHPIFRTVGTFIIVLMFEFFILGFHTTSDLSLGDLRSASSKILGPQDSTASWTLLVAAGMWIAVGALLAIWLSRSVRASPASAGRRIFLATRNGILGGLLFAPAFMSLYIVADRSIVALIGVFQGYGGNADATTFLNPFATLWHDIGLSQNSFFRNTLNFLLAAIAIPLGLLDLAAQKSIRLFMAVYLSMIAFVAVVPVFRNARALRPPALRTVVGLVWLVCLGYTLGPLAIALFRVLQQLAHKDHLLTLLQIIALAAFLWAVPGALLGALTPLLRRVATHTRNWAFVGYGSALLLVVATVWAQAWWPLVPALAAAVVGYMFQRGTSVHEYWPFAALCVAAGICGATSITQHFTFAAEVRDLHSIDMLQPAASPIPAIAGRWRSYDQLSSGEQAQVNTSNATTVAIINSDDGHTLYVPIWIPDAERVKAMVQLYQQYGPELDKQIADEEAAYQKALQAETAEQQMEIAKTPFSPILEAAARPNQPGNSAEPNPRPVPKTPAPAPVPYTNDDPALHGFGNPLLPASPGSVPPARPKTQTIPAPTPPPAATTNPPPATTSPINSAQPTPHAPENRQAAPSTAQQAADEAAKADAAAKALELSISGSVGFWVSVGLLACWSMEENDEAGAPHS